MKNMKKFLVGAAAAAAMVTTAAAPAQAQSWDRRDRGIDVGDVLVGVAILGGVAAAIKAFDGNNGYRYGSYGAPYGYGGYGYGAPAYGYGYNSYGSAQAAVNICARQAQRYGANVEIRDVDRTRGMYRVRGRVLVPDYDARWSRYSRSRDFDRENFTCYAQNGRIYDFRV